MDDSRDPMTVITETYRGVEGQGKIFQIVKQRMECLASHNGDYYYSDEQLTRIIEKGLVNYRKFRLVFFPNFGVIEG